MPYWQQLASSPVLHFTLIFTILALVRLVIITIADFASAIQRAGARRVRLDTSARETMEWLVPVRKLGRSRGLYSYASFGFHLGLLISSLFLANHLEILKRSIGISWMAFSKPILDVFCVFMIFGGGYLLYQRLFASASRMLSRNMDYLLLVILLNLGLSGFIAGQEWNPFPYNSLMLFHTLNGILILLLIPFTKISHCILFPLIRLGTEIGWQFPEAGGEKAIETLYGAEGRNI